MFGLNESTQYYVCQRYVRMNMGINGLYQIVRTEMELPPLGGAVFIFFSKNRQQVKLLKWDGDGFLLYQKRLERGTFELPFFDPKNKQCKMPYRTLSAIMSGICLKSMKYRKSNMEEEIIQPIDRELLKSELTPDKQLRMTNKSHNEIYIVTANDSPNVLKEIGRLREIAFREAGGGTGKSMDLDEFDFGDNCYKQLIVWNPEADEIIGGYRYLLGKDWLLDEKGQPKLATSHMFHFSDKFLKEYMPYTVELGRSFVSLEYQNVRTNTKSIFALDNLWDGLGALTVLYPEVKYFFGKMTMYPSYIRRGRDMILYFLKKHFDDKENLVIPMKPLKLDTPESDLAAIFTEDDFKADYRILNREVRKLGYNIPPLVNAYMSLSPTMKLFGTAINYGFGDVEETGILIAIDEILEEKRVRHINSFIKEHPEALKITSGANKVIYKEKNI